MNKLNVPSTKEAVRKAKKEVPDFDELAPTGQLSFCLIRAFNLIIELGGTDYEEMKPYFDAVLDSDLDACAGCLLLMLDSIQNDKIAEARARIDAEAEL